MEQRKKKEQGEETEKERREEWVRRDINREVRTQLNYWTGWERRDGWIVSCSYEKAEGVLESQEAGWMESIDGAVGGWGIREFHFGCRGVLSFTTKRLERKRPRQRCKRDQWPKYCCNDLCLSLQVPEIIFVQALFQKHMQWWDGWGFFWQCVMHVIFRLDFLLMTNETMRLNEVYHEICYQICLPWISKLATQPQQHVLLRLGDTIDLSKHL